MSIVEAGNAFRLATIGARVSYPPDYRKIIEEKTPYTTGKFYNPPPEILLEEVLAVIPQEVRMINIKRDLKLSKALVLQYYVAFTDQHNASLHPAFFPKSESMTLIKKIERTSRETNRPLTIPDQLFLALSATGNNLTQAILTLAVATRAMARNYDTRLISVGKEEMVRWYSCIAPFGYADETFDPPGDTYHFWNSVFAGISSQENRRNLYESLTGKVCDCIYTNTALATEILRHKICKKPGRTHATIDILGYEIGKALIGICLRH